MTTVIPAAMLDQALANISDVPSVGTDVDSGVPTVTFSGNYEPAVNDLADFLGALQRADEDAAEAAREGLYWQDGFYGGHGTATLNGVRIEGVSRYAECARCGDRDDEGQPALVGTEVLCTYCREEDEDDLSDDDCGNADCGGPQEH